MPIIKRVCSWCGRQMGEVESPNAKEGDITHGICDDCLKKEISENKEEPPIEPPMDGKKK